MDAPRTKPTAAGEMGPVDPLLSLKRPRVARTHMGKTDVTDMLDNYDELPANASEKDKGVRLAEADLSDRRRDHSEQEEATWSGGRAGFRVAGPITDKRESDLRMQTEGVQGQSAAFLLRTRLMLL